MDPRLGIIDRRLLNIKTLIPVSGGKGGVGKSVVASTLALTLSQFGYKVGLLDLDFCGPSAHVILGITGIYPKEEKGIIPPEIHGIKFMSIIHYAGDNPLPLRGIDTSNAVIELLAITRWHSLDFLIIDMPPGIGDTTLDAIRLMKSAKFLVVTTESKVALETVKKLLTLLKQLQVPIIGVIENMKLTNSSFVEDQIKRLNVPFCGKICFDANLEPALGDASKLAKTGFVQDLKDIVIRMPAFKCERQLVGRQKR